MRISTKVAGGGITAVSIAGLMVGLAIAYFSLQTQSQPVAVQAAQLDLDIVQSQVASSGSWLPGEIASLSWMVRNTGTSPVFLKGMITGEWSNTTLDLSKVQVSAIQIKREADTSFTSLPLATNTLPHEFFLSASSSEFDLWSVEPNERVEINVDVLLASTADNSYQAEPFAATLELVARQTTTGATWTE